jgi:hypothetical protein
MDRDRRLTGFLRGQTDKPIAPAGFELNNPWRVRIVRWEDELLENTILTRVYSLRNGSIRLPGRIQKSVQIVEKELSPTLTLFNIALGHWVIPRAKLLMS